MRRSSVGLTLVAVCGAAVLATALTLSLQPSPEDATWSLIRQTLENTGPTEGQLFDIPVRADGRTNAPIDGARWRLLEIDEPARLRFEPYLDIADGRWEQARGKLERLHADSPDDLRIANDLGVVYLELANEDATHLPAAFFLFDFVSRRAPTAPEPRFNIALTFDRLHLDSAAQRVVDEHQSLEPGADWAARLVRARESPLTDLERIVNGGDSETAWRAIEDDLDGWWDLMIDQLNAASEGPDFALSDQLMDRFENTFGDRTPRAIVRIESESARRLRVETARAVRAYDEQRFAEAVRILEEADRQQVPLTAFDRLWSELVLAESLAQTGRAMEVPTLVRRVIDRSESENFKWLQARALAASASDTRFDRSRAELIRRLRASIEIFETIGAYRHSSRAALFLGVFLFLEGSNSESLEVTQQALELIPKDDHLRRNQLFAIEAMNPITRGSELEIRLLEASQEQASLAGIPSLAALAHVLLAEAHERSGATDLRDIQLRSADGALSSLPDTTLRATATLRVIPLRARRLVEVDDPIRAIQLLEEGIKFVAREQVNVTFAQRYHLELARIYQDLGQITNARRELHSAVAAIEREDDALTGTARLTFDEQRREIYETAIAFELDQGNDDDALDLIASYKAKLLADVLAQYDQDDTVVAATGSPEAKTARPGTVLEYTLLDDRVVITARSGGGVEIRQNAVAREMLRDQVERWVDLIQRVSDSPEVDGLGRQLYGTLVAPVADVLPRGAIVTIIPDRILHRLPFHALIGPEGRYLVQDHVLLGSLATTYPQTGAPSGGLYPKLVLLGSLEDSTTIQREIRMIESVHDGIRAIDGFDVTPSVFLDSIADASMVHYAGHSAVDGVNALSSSILLGTDPNGGNRVEALDIARRRMAPGALVVLASCDSAIGNSIGGVGVRGLTSAFLLAGAGAVVGSLWPVESSATTDLMIRFHQNLADGMTIAESLRAAQLAMLEKQPHPYFWSGFNVTGTRSALAPASFIDSGPVEVAQVIP